MANEKKDIKVERSTFEYHGKECNEYFISGKIRGVDVKIKLAPPDPKDRGGYTVLDIVFGGENEADFVVEPFEFQDETGKTIAGERYLVRTEDKETGETYECAVKPARKSDKAALSMLMR
jgi:hypothetical protein